MDKFKELEDLLKKQYISYSEQFSLYHLVKGKKILLYGCGSGCITFFSIVLDRYNDIKIDGIIDKRAENGEKFRDIPLFNPESLNIHDTENYVVIITVGKKEYYNEIFNILKQKNFKNIILANQIYEYHLHFTSHEIEKMGFSYYKKQKDKILKAFTLFSDKLSIDIYLKYLKTHIYKVPQELPYESVEKQYFPDDIIMNYSRFINCGAYNGDTIRNLVKYKGKQESVVCFEPDLINYSKLIKYINNNKKDIADTIFAYPCGVYSKTTQIFFSSGNNTNSKISANGKDLIQTVKLDDALINYSPTFIQMDIEGAEIEAIKGGAILISTYKPDLAICVYHSVEHIWEIPLMLNKLNPDYKFYLRNYTGYISETVLYARSE
ncbi:FkbM family methyltransferase [Marinitoga sp. 1155]|uniref:FkbM family methyltransferase n=1 Tax=Marinitoga sp. 1155 TaxID=1428448 RepID=UPI00065A5A21|nr:FkbM family methyltransferase [Marinitoga sp. 1155]KLO21714.1 hypothetical protein X274_09970 [Marinitoga sp. 1155]